MYRPVTAILCDPRYHSTAVKLLGLALAVHVIVTVCTSSLVLELSGSATLTTGGSENDKDNVHALTQGTSINNNTY